ncbi:MAG: hypothetical protein M3401_17380 [Actinomycetota bacterium]|nr:hypothetical protein [Actinomycetota bacterium]
MSPTVAEGSVAPPRKARLPWVLLGVAIVLVLAMVPLSIGREPLFDTVFYGLLALSLGTMGAFVASRHPANPIGWVFCAIGIWGGVVETWEAFDYHSLPTSDVGLWIVGWSWVLDLTAYAVVFLLFPTGHLLTRRWRIVIWLLISACILGVPGQALNADNPENPLIVDSVAVQVMFGLGMMLLLVALAAALTSVVIRFRRAAGAERLQLKQLVFAGSVVLPTCVIAVPFYYDSVAVQAAIGLAFLALPLAAGLAILRYRLYDIDVVINRALVYGALTATLAGAYLAGVLLLQLILSGVTANSSLAVAGSTLAVAALFQPARGRIQATVDRRFFRRKYDAARTLERFGARLRDEVDLDALGIELRAVVGEAMQPAHVSLWLRPAGTRG